MSNPNGRNYKHEGVWMTLGEVSLLTGIRKPVLCGRKRRKEKYEGSCQRWTNPQWADIYRPTETRAEAGKKVKDGLPAKTFRCATCTETTIKPAIRVKGLDMCECCADKSIRWDMLIGSREYNP